MSGGAFGRLFRRHRDNPAPVVVPITPSRPGLLIGYFGSDDAQVGQTADHVNLLFAAWGSDEQLAARIAAAGMATILDVSDCLFTDELPRHFRGVEEASRLLDKRLAVLRGANVLERVVCLYVIDEPEREADMSEQAIGDAAGVARMVAQRYGIAPALHICFGDGRDYRGLKFIDWAGVNDYDGDAIALLRELKEQLQPTQRLVAYPGGADPWRNNPRPFYDYAQGEPAVVAIVSFLWVPYAKPGIRDNGEADAYREVGKSILLGSNT